MSMIARRLGVIGMFQLQGCMINPNVEDSPGSD